MQGVNPQLLAPRSHILGRQHSSIGRGLVAVGFDFHAASHSGDGFAATGITQISLCGALYLGGGLFEGPPCPLCTRVHAYERSVTWTKVSLKEAKIRATPKTSSPVQRWRVSDLLWDELWRFGRREEGLAFTDLGTERDILGGSALDLLLGRHDCGLFGDSRWVVDQKIAEVEHGNVSVVWLGLLA